MKPSELVTQAMKHTKAQSGAALGDLIGIDRRRIADYGKNARWPDNNHARLLAEAAGLNPLEVIAELEMAKAEDEATKTAWGKALANIRGKVAVLMLAVVATFAASGMAVELGHGGAGRR